MTEPAVSKVITPRHEDFSQWYVDTILRAELADYAPVKGCMVIRPYGYAIWERIQAALDHRIKATGHRNVYFPLFIPEEYLAREKEHVEGFAPEVAWVTQGGGETLPERLAVRPTSEAIIGPMYAKWVQSYRDLPLLYNQWANVVRWEKATRPFLRTTEFLWQEGHTVHATAEEARSEALKMLDLYRDFIEHEMAVPVIAGRKTPHERFAGAVETFSLEGLMGDGRALQAATSHDLGQHFAEVYDIKFLDRDGQLKYASQSSWGASTRLIGALIMVHGDDKGLRLPPRMAPTQVVIVPISSTKDRESVLTRARHLAEKLSELYRVHLDDRDELTPGYKFNDWEMRGVPLRLELGPRDLKDGKAVLCRRDTGQKESVAQETLLQTVGQWLGEVQDNLWRQAKEHLELHTKSPESFAELGQLMATERGFAKAGWCGQAACEERAKAETGATIRNIPMDQHPVEKCLVCGQPAQHQVYWARAY